MNAKVVQPSIDEQIRAAETAKASNGGNVRSIPMPDTAPRMGTSRIVGIFALVIGLPFWLEAARFTRDGWIGFINWLCTRLSIPWQVPILDWKVMIGLILALGLGYSYIEIGKQPIRMPHKWSDALDFKQWEFQRRWEVWAVWVVLIISDVGTTYLGAKNPDPSGLAIMADISSRAVPLAIYAILLTFIPDRLCKFGWHSIKGK